MPSDNSSGLDLKRVLIVDDDAVCRMTTRVFLERYGLTCLLAASGEEALEVVGNGQADIVLLDYYMDGLSGIETCQRIRQDEAHGSLPVIFVTSSSDTETIVSAFGAGASDYITKPFHPEEAIARIRTHLHLSRLIKAQEQYIEALREAEKSRSKFLSVISHDLRNPISAIRGLAEYLKTGICGSLQPDQQEMAESIHSAAVTMQALVTDLLDYAKFGAGKMRLQPERFNLTELIAGALTLHRVYASEKAIQLIFDDHLADPMIEADPSQIRRVLDNLLTNAIKFSPRGTQTTVRTGPVDDDIVFHVEDEGPGIPEGEESTLFDEFGTTSVKPTGGEPSSGIGLSVVKKIVEAHGGSIEVSNAEKGGARFTVILNRKVLCLSEPSSPTTKPTSAST